MIHDFKTVQFKKKEKSGSYQSERQEINISKMVT